MTSIKIKAKGKSYTPHNSTPSSPITRSHHDQISSQRTLSQRNPSICFRCAARSRRCRSWRARPRATRTSRRRGAAASAAAAVAAGSLPEAPRTRRTRSAGIHRRDSSTSRPRPTARRICWRSGCARIRNASSGSSASTPSSCCRAASRRRPRLRPRRRRRRPTSRYRRCSARPRSRHPSRLVTIRMRMRRPSRTANRCSEGGLPMEFFILMMLAV